LRELTAESKHLAKIVHFGDQQVFSGATTYTCLLFLDKAGNDRFRYVKAHDLEAWRTRGEAVESEIRADKATASEWNFVVGPGAPLFERLSRMPIRLGDVAHIFVGLQTSADKVYTLEEVVPPQGDSVQVRDLNGKEWSLERGGLRPFLNKVTVSTFERPVSHHWLVFPYRFANKGATLIPATEMASSFPRVWAYLKENAKVLRGRESGKADHDEWYGYIYRKNLTSFDDPKLIVQVISLFGRYAYDDTGIYFTGGGNGPYYGIRWLDSDNPHSLHYLQGLLGTPLLDFCLHQVSSPFRGGYWSYGKRFIEQLPIRTIDFDNPTEASHHSKIVALVECMLDLRRRLAAAQIPDDKKLYQRQIAATDRQIDALVYELYGLTKKEIRIVEDATT